MAAATRFRNCYDRHDFGIERLLEYPARSDNAAAIAGWLRNVTESWRMGLAGDFPLGGGADHRIDGMIAAVREGAVRRSVPDDRPLEGA